MSHPYHDHNPAPIKKKRGTLFIVIVASIAVHLLAGGVLAVIKITEVLQKEAEFEAPPLEAVEPPPPPPPPPPTTQRTQKSMPRPQPLAAQNPQNMDVPAIEIDRSNLNMLSGRGFGGGLGDIGGGVMDSITSIEFFGMESSGGSVAILFDCTWSGADVFDEASEELIKTIKQVDKTAGTQLAVIYFGGGEGGHRKGPKSKEDLEKDFWYPRGVDDGWLASGDPALKKIVRQLRDVQDDKKGTKVRKYKEYLANDKAFFIVLTNLWGALNEAYSLRPPPNTVYLIVEPRVAFRGVIEKAFERFDKFGRKRPANTKVVVIATAKKGELEEGGKFYEDTVTAVNLLNGGNLSEKEIEDLFVPVYQ